LNLIYQITKLIFKTKSNEIPYPINLARIATYIILESEIKLNPFSQSWFIMQKFLSLKYQKLTSLISDVGLPNIIYKLDEKLIL